MKRAEPLLLGLLCLSPALAEPLPDDDFLEYLGASDEAWLQACDPNGYLPSDDACTETDDDDNDDEQ